MVNTNRLYIQLGSNCNCDCVFCAVADSRHFPELSLERVQEHLQLGFAKGFRKLTISGGEPTIRKDLPDIVAAAKKAGYVHIQVQTNGRALANRQYLIRLFDAGVDTFLPSIHGHCAKIHDTIMRAPGSFAQTIRGIENLAELQHPPLNTNTVITKQNYQFLPDLGRLLVSIGVDQIQLSYVQAEGNAKNIIIDLGPQMTKAHQFIQETIRISKPHNVHVLVDGIPQCIMINGCLEHVRDLSIIPTVTGITETNDLKLATKPGKLKNDFCHDCILSYQCGGVWEKYIGMYGWEEFRPVSRQEIVS